MLTADNEPIIFEIWLQRPQFEVWGTRRQDFQTEQVNRFRNVFRFNSSVGRWIIVTDDEILTKEHAINFAKAIFEERYSTFHVDTTLCNE